MRISLQIELMPDDPGIIPVNYQYPVAAWIYSRLALADPIFSTWLHDKGYKDGFRGFKLFTFSNLQMKGRITDSDRLQLMENRGSIIISFLLEDGIGKFIHGIFREGNIRIGDSKSNATFQIRSVESLGDPKYTETVHYRALSPVVISKFDEERKQPAYLRPEDPDYADLLINNLKHKLKVSSPESILPEWIQHASVTDFEIKTTPRSRLITVKSGYHSETRIRGYEYEFKITMLPELHHIGYSAGFGEKNSMGFGCVGVKVMS